MSESLTAPLLGTPGAAEGAAPPESDAGSLLYPAADAGPAETTEPQTPAEEQAPVTYEPFQLPQGVDVDTAALEEAQSLFAEARLSQPQAQKLVDLYAGKLGELVQRQISAAQERQKAWVAEVKSDPELGGRRFESARAAAQKALERFGTPELRRTLDELGVSNSPQLFRFFVRVGQAVREDSWIGMASGDSRLSAAETLYPNQNSNKE